MTAVLGEIRAVPFNFAPVGWATCDGQLMSISQNTALFSLLGTTYGGDGKSTFALPDLRGATPIHAGQGPGLSSYALGEAGGAETVTLNAYELPPHRHAVHATNSFGTSNSPVGAHFAEAHVGTTAETTYRNATDNLMSKTSFGGAGGNQAHNNMAPYLTLTFIIALQGVFPSRS